MFNHHKNVLREISKFATGLVTADFLVGAWLLSSSLTPINFWGVTFTSSMLWAWMIFDLVLLAILIHYAWHADVHTPSIRQKTLFIVVGIVTGVVSLAHLLRILFGVSIDIGGWQFPIWLSWLAVIAALLISYSSFRFAMKK